MKQPQRIKVQVDTTPKLRQTIKSALDKLNNACTVQTGFDELKEIMQVHVTSSARMIALILVLSEQNEHMTLAHKKEVAKLYGIMGEIFGENLLAFVPRILSSCEQRWEDPQMHIPISDSIGVMVHHVLRQLSSPEEQTAHFAGLVQALSDLVKTTKQTVQTGVAMCLTRVVQNGPPEIVVQVLPQLADQLDDLLHSPAVVKCPAQLIEILISLMLSTEVSFEPFAKRFIPSIVDLMSPKQDSAVRKLAIDAVYTLAAFLPDTLDEHAESILSILKDAKADKSKHVREAAHEALLKIKEVRPKDDERPFETPPKGGRKAEEEAQCRSIFKTPVDPKFIQAAPKSSIEIRTVGPAKDPEDKKAGDADEPSAKEETKGQIQVIDVEVTDEVDADGDKGKAAHEKKHKVGPGAKPEGDPESEIESEPDPDPEADADPKPEADAKHNEDVKSDADIKPEENAKSSADTGAKLNADAKLDTDAKHDADATEKPDADAAEKTDEDPKSDVNAKPDADADADAQPGEDAKSEADEDAKHGKDAKLGTDVDKRPDADAGLDENAKQGADEKHETDADHVTDTKPLPAAEPSKIPDEKASKAPIVSATVAVAATVQPENEAIPVQASQPVEELKGVAKPVPEVAPSIGKSATETLPNKVQSLQMTVDKIAKQQMRLIENLNSFQTVTRKEISSLRDKMGYLEEMLERMSKSFEQDTRQNTSYAVSAVPEPKKTEDSNNNASLWNRMVELAGSGKYDEAFTLALGRKDNFLLLRLMGKTGIVVERLESQTVENLLSVAVELIDAGEFIELLLGWIVAVVDRKIPLSTGLKNVIANCLVTVCENDSRSTHIDEFQISEANRIYNIIKGSLSSPSKRQSQ